MHLVLFLPSLCIVKTRADLFTHLLLRAFFVCVLFPSEGYSHPAPVCSHLPWHYLYPLEVFLPFFCHRPRLCTPPLCTHRLCHCIRECLTYAGKTTNTATCKSSPHLLQAHLAVLQTEKMRELVFLKDLRTQVTSGKSLEILSGENEKYQ